MRRIVVVVASLLLATLVMTPGVAAEKAGQRNVLTLDAPVRVSQTTARLAGRVPGSQRVVTLQRLVAGQWASVARVRVTDRRYRTLVRTAAAPQRYRTVTGSLRSPVRTVPGVQASADPTPTSPTPTSPTPTSPTPTPTNPALPNDACGTPRVKADGSPRLCTFADDFNGSQLDLTKWVPQTNFLSGDRAGAYACYHPENVAVGNGALQLTLRKEPAPVACGQGATPPSVFTAGGVSTYRLFSQAFGRFEARIKNTATTVPGLQESFWLWPDDRQSGLPLWPAAGEIDISETYSHLPTLSIPFLHYRWNDNLGPVPGLNTAWNCSASRGVWNTFALEWTSTKIQIFVNGKSCLVNTSADVAIQRKFIVALTHLLGLSDNTPVAGTPLPSTMYVDYVRVWE
jgi:beta-glucanase (GH16 family)